MNQGFIVWEDEYRLGHEKIDSQHQQIIEMINDLYEARFYKKEQMVVSEVIERMCHYVTEHFQDEELLMAAIGYPDLEIHQSEHKFFIAKASQLCPRRGDGNVDIDDLMVFLKDWLLEHIAKTDHQYKPYLGKD